MINKLIVNLEKTVTCFFDIAETNKNILLEFSYLVSNGNVDNKNEYTTAIILKKITNMLLEIQMDILLMMNF